MAAPFVEQLVQSKLVLLGEMGSGKTSLVQRFVRGQYFENQVGAVGAWMGQPPAAASVPAARVRPGVVFFLSSSQVCAASSAGNARQCRFTRQHCSAPCACRTLCKRTTHERRSTTLWLAAPLPD